MTSAQPWRCEHGPDSRTCDACTAKDEAFLNESAHSKGASGVAGSDLTSNENAVSLAGSTRPADGRMGEDDWLTCNDCGTTFHPHGNYKHACPARKPQPLHCTCFDTRIADANDEPGQDR